MSTATDQLDVLTIGEIADRAGAPTWAVRRTLDALGIARRVGPSMRIIAGDDLPAVVAELARRGYIDQPATAADPGAVASGVASPSMRNAPGLAPRGVSTGSLSGPLSKGADRRPDHSPEAARREKSTPG